MTTWQMPNARCCLWFVALAAACSAPAVTPAAPAPSAETAPRPHAIARREPEALPALRVGSSGDYAPFSTLDARGAPQGFDAEVARLLARDLGMHVEWVSFRWPELTQQLTKGSFDVAMSGVTWQPQRAVVGYMTRAVAYGGPCVLGDANARRVAVNRGGILEAWARRALADRELVTVDDNLSLPALLAERKVGAIVTDSFERRAFERPGTAARCEPPFTRKVYWVSSSGGRALGERIDAWLRSHTEEVQAQQQRWFGERQRLDAGTHLVDLIARRLAFMPLIADLKLRTNIPIEDRAREREVLEAVTVLAGRQGLPQPAVARFFALQIELSKAVQRRQREPSSLDLSRELRPAVSELGERILDALVDARAADRLDDFTLADLELLSPWLTPEERQQMLRALLDIAEEAAPAAAK